MNSSIKKYVVGGVIVAAFAAYAIFNSNQNTNTATLPSLSSLGTTPSSSSPTTSTSASGAPPANTGKTGTSATTPASGAYKDGTYTGTVADAFYGNLQVVAVVQNGQLADVQFPQYPSDNGRSKQISNTALPILKQEAISAQSANVNVVSGATQVSQAFRQSLASALAQA